MSNFWGGFAKGFEKSYDQDSISKGMLEGYKKKEAREEFERWASTPANQDMMERVGYTPHKDSTLDELKDWADISSKMFTMGEKETKAERAGSFDSMMGSIMGEGFKTAGIMPPEEAMRRQDPSQVFQQSGQLTGSAGQGGVGQVNRVPVQDGGIQPPQGQIGMTGLDVTPTGGTLKYGQTPESKYQFDIMKNIKGKNVDMRSKLEMTRLSNTYNLNLVGAAARDASDLLVEAYLEGGAGDRLKSTKTFLAAKGWLGEAGENYDAAGTYMGKRGELILKMFPMFTQQLGKEGSIRLIVSVLDLIGVTIPDLYTPDKMARRQYEGTLNSLYEVRRALDNINLDEYDLTQPGKKKDFRDAVREETSKLQLTSEDSQLRSEFVNQSLVGLDEYLRNKDLLKQYVEDPRNKGVSKEKIYRRLQEMGKLK